MKLIRNAAILMAMLIIPAQAHSQGRARGSAGPDDAGDRDRREGVQADAILKFQEQLNLSPEQIERIRESQDSDRAARDAARLETQGLRDRLGNREITQDEFREKMAMRRSTTAETRSNRREMMNGILTEEQRSQMQDLRQGMDRGQGVRSGRGGRRGQGSNGPRGQGTGPNPDSPADPGVDPTPEA